MGRLLRSAPGGPVAVIGADIPGITTQHIADAFHRLRSQDAVIGPAEDGGYWLIGLARRRAPPPCLFANVRWSGPHARLDTLATLAGHRIGEAATLADIDTLRDLIRFRQGSAPNTRCHATVRRAS